MPLISDQDLINLRNCVRIAEQEDRSMLPNWRTKYEEAESALDRLEPIADQEILPNYFPKDEKWKPGERVEQPLWSGSYPTGKTRQGTVLRVEEYLRACDRLIIKFDDEDEERAINTDVIRHVADTD